MIRWMRVVLPPDWAIGLFAMAYAVFELCFPKWLITDEPPPELSWLPVWLMIFATPAMGVLVAALPLYGAFRSIAFHPIYRPAYRRWLESTPWTSRKPPPLGPLHLVWQDLVVLGVLGGVVLRLPGLHWASPFIALFLFYLTPIVFSFAITGQKRFAYVIAFSEGFGPLLGSNRIACLCLTALLYGITWLGIRRMLARFPWDMSELEDQLRTGLSAEVQMKKLTGWPFNRLRPEETRYRIGHLDRTLICLLAGWWLFALLTLEPSTEREKSELWRVYGFLAIAAVVCRVLAYCWGYRPPISLWGRICTFRLIIPGYDQVFVAPFCAGLAAYAVPFFLLDCGLRFEIVVPVSTTAFLLILLNMGPSLGRWKLTGSHRIVPALFAGPPHVQL